VPLRFPGPSVRTDLFALHVVTRLNAINQGSGFMVSIGELDNGRLIVAFSGATRGALEAQLEAQLRAIPPPYQGFRRVVIEGQSSLHTTMLNPHRGRRYGLHYGGSRNCSEPKIIEMTAILGRRLIAMTTVWYGPPGNRAYRQNYLPYRVIRAPLGGVHGGLQFARPCEICQANERRLMLYLEQGFPRRTRPRFGSYEAPF
jgi:hypothetical protein